MKIFLDTSSLFKLYHNEVGTIELENLFSKESISEVYLSEITKIEFSSTLFKKVRTNEITFDQANFTLELFQNDFAKYSFITTDSSILEEAKNLVSKYGLQGLRTLKSIQLATCLSLKNHVQKFLTSDKLLAIFLENEGLNCLA